MCRGGRLVERTRSTLGDVSKNDARSRLSIMGISMFCFRENNKNVYGFVSKNTRCARSLFVTLFLKNHPHESAPVETSRFCYL